MTSTDSERQAARERIKRRTGRDPHSYGNALAASQAIEREIERMRAEAKR